MKKYEIRKFIKEFTKSDGWKSFRDGVFALIAVLLVDLLNKADTIDFGEYDKIVAAIIAVVVARINRATRKKI